MNARRSELRASALSETRDLAALGPEWDALLEGSGSHSVFLTWSWLHSWWCHLARSCELRVISVRDGEGRLRGVGPFCIRPDGRLPQFRILSFLGTERVSSEYLDVIASPSLEEEVVSAVWQALLATRGDWDFARLPDMLETACLLRHPFPAAERARFVRDTRPSQICPRLALPASRDDLAASLGGPRRRRMQQARRHLERAGASIETLASAPQVEAALETFFRLHALRWAARQQTGNFQDPRVRAFHCQLARDAAPSGRVRFYRMSHEGSPIAMLYALEYKDTMFYYQSGFDPDGSRLGLRPHEYSPGSVLVHHAILDAIDRGLAWFDFLRGSEAYKYRWARDASLTRTLTVIPRAHLPAIARHRLAQAAEVSKRALKRLTGSPRDPEVDR